MFMKKKIFPAVIFVLLIIRIGLHVSFSAPATVQENQVPQSTTPEQEIETPKTGKYLESIEIGGEWFLNNQDEDFIFYQYNPYDKIHPDKHQSMREMGALWSITVLHNFLDDERYLTLAEKGFSHFEKTFEYDEENDFYYVNITPEKIKLGYNAFMILALLELEHPEKEKYLEKFADGIIYQQNEDGGLRTFFYSDRSTGVDYYPGEALVSLMALYEYTKDEKYLETVQKAFPYYVGYFQKNANTAFVPWQSRAYAMLYQQTGNREVADFLFEMNDYMLEQNDPQDKCSNFTFPRGGTTSVFMEGVNKAYDVAKEVGDKERMDCYANYIREGADYMLKLQITEEEIQNEDLEIEALGGFLGSPTSKSHRVDRNQHATMALMDAYDSGLLE
jgi:hypothetical protein